MRFTISNFHVGEVNVTNNSYDSEGNAIAKDERSFGGFDMNVEVELTPEELVSYHKTLIEMFNGCGPLIDKVTAAINKVKNNS